MHDLQLPPAALAIARRIEAILRQAKPFTAGAATDDDVYALRETEARYLPQTIRAYLDVPVSLRGIPNERGTTADDELIEQLSLLERATAERFARIGGAARDALATQGLFLSERFGPLASQPEASIEAISPPADAALPAGSDVLPAVLVRRLLDDVPLHERAEGRALLETLARRFSEAFPQLTRVRLGGLFGKRIDGVEVDVPTPSGGLRYILALGRGGTLEASYARIVRGVTLKSEQLGIEHWTQALLEHLGEYIQADRGARQHLKAFLQ
jgi:hypothetical protein